MVDILIADDEAHARRILQMALQRDGYSLRAAENGEDALRQFRERMPDLLITDQDMPKMTGQQLCARLLDDHPDLPIPVLVLTSRTEREHKDWVAKIPRGEFLEKPVSLKQLSRRLKELFPEGA